jgi:hypothetical protein
MLSYFSLWRATALLCGYGMRDEALLCLVASVPFSGPSDRDVAAISESRVEDCVIALDENLLWCRISVAQAERILRMLRSGELALSVHSFEPNSPLVLSGGRARLLPASVGPLGALATARRQPEEGFRTPHHIRASLKLGPHADLSEIRRVVTGLRSNPLLSAPVHTWTTIAAAPRAAQWGRSN